MMRELEKAVMLKVVDSKWMEHLDDMDMLKEGISLRSYGQRNPIVEYKVEAFDIFEEMQQAMMETIILYLYHIQIRFTTDPEEGAHLENRKLLQLRIICRKPKSTMWAKMEMRRPKRLKRKNKHEKQFSMIEDRT